MPSSTIAASLRDISTVLVYECKLSAAVFKNHTLRLGEDIVIQFFTEYVESGSYIRCETPTGDFIFKVNTCYEYAGIGGDSVYSTLCMYIGHFSPDKWYPLGAAQVLTSFEDIPIHSGNDMCVKPELATDARSTTYNSSRVRFNDNCRVEDFVSDYIFQSYTNDSPHSLCKDCLSDNGETLGQITFVAMFMMPSLVITRGDDGGSRARLRYECKEYLDSYSFMDMAILPEYRAFQESIYSVRRYCAHHDTPQHCGGTCVFCKGHQS